jgi:phosphate transport system permease protein
MTLVEDSPAQEGSMPDVESRPAQPKRKVRGLTRAEWVEYAIAAAAGIHLALLLRTLLDWNDLMGSALIAGLVFIGVHYLIVRERTSPDVALDKVVTTVMWTVAAVIVAMLFWMLAYVAVRGLKLLSWTFLTTDLSTTGSLESGGGALHAIIGTVEQVAIATAVVVPVAILTAVYLHELKGRAAGVIRFVVDSLSGVPSIVAGLLIFTIWPGYAGIKASAALAILTLPIVTRASEEILRTVPDSLREASLALGAPQWKVVLRVVLPTARTGLATATILGVARMAGETAPALYTAFGSASVNLDPLNGAQSSLPLFVWDLIRVPDQRQNDRAWAGALVLVIIVLVLFATARFLSARADKKLGRR